MKIIKTLDDIVKCYDLIKKIPFIDMTYHTCFLRCTQGKYTCVTHDNGICVFFKIKGTTTAHVVGVYAENKLQKHQEDFEGYLKDFFDIDKLTCVSSRNPEAYEKLTGFKRIWTKFEKEI